ncbi:MAG: hypothetical protein WD097_05025 [Balneolales bacterium]
MKNRKDEWLRRYLDGELSDKDDARVLHLIADDPELRALLKFDLQLRQNFAADPSAQEAFHAMSARDKAPQTLPDGFADKVMQSISRLNPHEEPQVEMDQDTDEADSREYREYESGYPDTGTIHGRMRTLRNRLWQPRPVMWRPVWSAGIAAMLLVLVLATPFLITLRQESPPVSEYPVQQIVNERPDRVMMRFVYVDRDANSVAVAGDFSDWEPISLNRQTINGDIAWTGIVPLSRGEHRYMFIKDGDEWTTDPFASRFVDDGFGNKNAVINL